MQSRKIKRDISDLPLVLTVVHSTRTLAEFIRLLHSHEVSCADDVRRVPRFRWSPDLKMKLRLIIVAGGRAGVSYKSTAFIRGRCVRWLQ